MKEISEKIPKNKIVIFPHENLKNEDILKKTIVSMKGKKNREWFTQNFYFCLPLMIANQYGFSVLSEIDFYLEWDGSNSPDGLKIYSEYNAESQILSSHFGNGILTVSNLWSIRTHTGINTMIAPPPNFFKNGISYMSAVIESDNLRRDFTFNIKITEKNKKIYFKKGDPLGFILPIPRRFVDDFEIDFANNILSKEEIFLENIVQYEFERKRNTEDKDKPYECGRLYFKGLDSFGNKFHDHQIKID